MHANVLHYFLIAEGNLNIKALHSAYTEVMDDGEVVASFKNYKGSYQVTWLNLIIS